MVLSVENRLDENKFLTDSSFDSIYPTAMRELTYRHWTPLRIARLAAGFLSAEKGAKVLDIGSGVGKFCLAAAHFMPAATYVGVELRKNLVNVANIAKEELNLTNVSFIHQNFTRINLRKYTGVYFYNSFYENLESPHKIDERLELSNDNYNYYNRQLYKLLSQMPKGSRLATFHSSENEVPPCFLEVGSEANNLLKFWVNV